MILAEDVVIIYQSKCICDSFSMHFWVSLVIKSHHFVVSSCRQRKIVGLIMHVRPSQSPGAVLFVSPSSSGNTFALLAILADRILELSGS